MLQVLILIAWLFYRNLDPWTASDSWGYQSSAYLAPSYLDRWQLTSRWTRVSDRENEASKIKLFGSSNINLAILVVGFIASASLRLISLVFRISFRAYLWRIKLASSIHHVIIINTRMFDFLDQLFRGIYLNVPLRHAINNTNCFCSSHVRFTFVFVKAFHGGIGGCLTSCWEIVTWCASLVWRNVSD